MNKILRRLIINFLALVLIFCSACTNSSSDSSSSDSTGEEVVTGIDLVKGGKSTAKIVVPTETSTDIDVASKELQFFFQEATGITLNIVADSSIVYSDKEVYLSIGHTSLYQASEISVSHEELGASGIKLVTDDNTVLMVGYSDLASMYAMYEFLERTFNLEVYAEDEYYIDTNVTDLKLKDFNVTEIPVFDRRSVGLYPYSVSATFRNRMRQNLFDESWIYWSHSYFKILPKETYYDQQGHKDWYTPDGNNLCVTNDEMREEFTRVVIDLVKNNPDCSYIMLGQQDNASFCSCTVCARETEKYKNSGVMLRFVNQVADDVQKYIDENEPGRIFYVGTFAYQDTEAAPVNYVNGEYVAVDDSVRPHKNVRIMVAPIKACNAHDFWAPCNKDLESVLNGWKAVADGQMFFWIYNKIFSNYFIPFNNFSTIVDNYSIIEDIGVEFVYHQGNKETQAGGMQELMTYVEAKLMWDSSLNFNDLVEDFCEHYYKDAGKYYQEYFNLVRFNYAQWVEAGLHCHNSTSKSELIFDSKYWTENLLGQMENLFAAMLNSIEKYKNTDEELYNTLALRIKKERLTVRYLYMSFYSYKLTYQEMEEYIADFEETCAQTGISVWQEKWDSNQSTATISALIAKWEIELSQK